MTRWEKKPAVFIHSSNLILYIASVFLQKSAAKVSTIYDEWPWKYSARQLEQLHTQS